MSGTVSVGRRSVWASMLLTLSLAIATVACADPEPAVSSPTTAPPMMEKDGTATPTSIATPATLQDETTGRAALVALYNATDGARWKDNTNWLSEAPVGEWHGVTTDTGGHVTEVSLYDNQLTGPIPAELGNLPGLQSLILYANQLTGPIPPELGDLANLQEAESLG